jgi:SNF2 family DNA or RNA helicase
LEWKNGSFEEELRKDKHTNAHSFRIFNYDLFHEHSSVSPCSLLKVHWLRLVVDEGHSMGKNGRPTNVIDFASWISAERRWAMTGTPTPQTIDKVGLSNLFGLVKFLKHDYFVVKHWGDKVCKILPLLF